MSFLGVVQLTLKDALKLPDSVEHSSRAVDFGTATLGRFETIRLILTRSLEMSALEPKVAVKER